MKYLLHILLKYLKLYSFFPGHINGASDISASPHSKKSIIIAGVIVMGRKESCKK